MFEIQIVFIGSGPEEIREDREFAGFLLIAGGGGGGGGGRVARTDLGSAVKTDIMGTSMFGFPTSNVRRDRAREKQGRRGRV